MATAALTDCANTPPPAPIVAASPTQAVPIDGTYGGLMQLTRGSAMSCGDQDRFMLRVTNRSFTFQLAQPRAEWKPVIVFKVEIGNDGSFNVRSGASYMRGKVAGGSMQGEISGDICGYAFNADRGGTY